MKKLLIILITLLFISFAGNISPPTEDVTYDVEMIETISQDVPVVAEIEALYYQATWICTSMPGELFSQVTITIDGAFGFNYNYNSPEVKMNQITRESSLDYTDIGYRLQPGKA